MVTQEDFDLTAKTEGMPEIVFSHQKHTFLGGEHEQLPTLSSRDGFKTEIVISLATPKEPQQKCAALFFWRVCVGQDQQPGEKML